MKCSTEKNSAFILSTQNNHTIASTVATGSVHVWCYHLSFSSVTPKRWISGRKNIWIGIFHSYFLFCLFLLPQAFLGKMLYNRPPIIGGVLWGVYYIKFCPKMPVAKEISKTKNQSENFQKIRKIWKIWKNPIFIWNLAWLEYIYAKLSISTLIKFC